MSSVNLDSRSVYDVDRKIYVLPPAIARLSSLERLHIYGVNMRELPEFTGGLQWLLSLSYSFSSRVIFPSSMWRLPKLNVLDLSSAHESFPDKTALPSLQTLSLSNCGLQALPDSFGNLTALSKLSIDNNPLQILPASMAKLQAIYLNISATLINSIGPICNMTSMQDLYAQSCARLTSIGCSFLAMTTLKTIHFQDSVLRSFHAFDGLLSGTTQIEELDLRGNQVRTRSLPITFARSHCFLCS